MRKYLYILSAAALVLVSGCKKDFLDAKPSQSLSAEQIADAAKRDPSLLNGNIAGLYSTMYNVGTGGTTGHDDFGQKGYDIYSDMLASDMVLGAVNYGWYSQIARYQATKDFTLNQTYAPWRYYYRIIFAANAVIDALGGTEATPTEATQKYIMGQAKAMRAYGYFYLAQFYSEGYGTGNEKILPIYLNTEVPNQAKSTTAQVYTLIVDDLTKSIDLLAGFNRTSKDQVNQTVARGLLAYALAARGSVADLNQVVTLTDAIINTGGLRLVAEDEVVANLNPTTGALLNTQSGFNNVSNPSWIWGVDLTLDNNLDLISWWGQMDLYTYSYAWAGDPKLIDNALFAKIRTDDLRKRQFDAQLLPTRKFFHPGRVIGGQRNITTDYVYMRAEEFYLLNAEAKAKLAMDAPARDRLKQLLSKRITNIAYVDALNGQALKDEIYLQTRIELWGEGKSYLALKRNKATATRGTNHLFEAGKSFTFDSDELTFPIPQAEVLNNPVLGQ
ncbi:MAG: RagB/SusD family nutrient uptake outer membrane protein [Bacteroidota bacterium]